MKSEIDIQAGQGDEDQRPSRKSGPGESFTLKIERMGQDRINQIKDHPIDSAWCPSSNSYIPSQADVGPKSETDEEQQRVEKGGQNEDTVALLGDPSKIVARG